MSNSLTLNPALSHLECVRAGHTYEPLPWRGLCDCGSPLAARYDLSAIEADHPRDRRPGSRRSIWRWQEVLPHADNAEVRDLGEGGTPLLRSRHLAMDLGLSNLWIKDESGNPTGSFKARGLSMAVHMAKAAGARHVAVPSAGNAGAALSAYAAALGLEAHVFMPQDTPRAVIAECETFGADVQLVDGLISDAGRILRERAPESWFDLSTLREPYRVEGKKTLGYEIAEAFHWKLPDVVIYPTGGGTGLLGMWKAFEELEALGWIETGQRPRMISVQAEGCAPIVRAFENGEETAAPWENATTIAAGLRVPGAIADFWILRVLKESGGMGVAVSEEDLLRETLRFSRREGILACPEGGAALAALRRLVSTGSIKPQENVVLFNTGTGIKYLEALQSALDLETASQTSGS